MESSDLQTDLLIRRRIATGETVIRLGRNTTRAELEAARETAGETEVLMPADASAAEIAEIRRAPLFAALAADYAALGLGLRLVPASLNPDLAGWESVQSWVEADRQEVRVGITAGADAGSVGYEACLALAIALGFPVNSGADRDRDFATEAVRKAFALTLCAQHGADGVLVRQLRALGRKIELRALANELDAKESAEAAVILWACLVALKPAERTTVLSHVERVSPATAMLAKKLLARMKTPRTTIQAHAAVEKITLALRASQTSGIEARPAQRSRGHLRRVV